MPLVRKIVFTFGFGLLPLASSAPSAVKKLDESFKRPQAGPQVFFEMGFDGVYGMKVLRSQGRKNLGERDLPLPHRQMLIGLAVVVMKMHLQETGPQNLNPLEKGNFREQMSVAGVEAVSDAGGIEGIEESL